MPYITRTEVALSKTKLSLSLLGCVAFVAIGIWLFSAAPSIAAYPIIFCQALGIISIVFFGFIGVFIARKLQDNKPGLIIDEEGITDNSSAVAGGSIVWRDIKDIYVIEIGRQKLMMIEVVNPEKYIERQAHYLTKKAMLYNLNRYNTPLSITANGLKCDFEDLYRLIKDNLEIYLNHEDIR